MTVTGQAAGTARHYGFIGLGHQGSPMAERMIEAGLRPWLWARRSEILARYADREAVLATSPADMAGNVDVIGLCMYDAEATDNVIFGPDGLLETVRPGTLLAIHATVGPDYVTELAERVAEHGVRIVDAPVSGGDQAALAGRLVVIEGGADPDLDACAVMFAAYTHRVVRAGAVGSAQTAKLINNGLMTAITGLVYDAFVLGEQLGIPPVALGEVLGNGSAANPSVQTYLTLGGAQEFSARAWPTLHKDVALLDQLVTAHRCTTARLQDCATTTIREMERLRS